MNSWDVYGHDWAVEMLQRHVADATLRHAYLFTGPAGVGRRTLATRLAQALNCTKPAAPGVPCRMCRACKQIEAEQHPDLLVIRKLPEKKDILIEQIREVSKFLSLKPYMAAYKIVLMLDFESANKNAQNALLKTLEEAPDYGLLLITAENAEQLEATVVSRCEIMRLRPLPLEVLVDFLASQGVSAEKTRLVAHLAGGRAGYGLHLCAEDGNLLAFRSEKLDDLRRLLAGGISGRFKYAEILARDKDLFRQTLQLWSSYWRDVLLRTSGAATELTNIDRAGEIDDLARQMDLPLTRAMAAGVEKAIDRLDRNVNPRLLAEAILLDWPRVK